MSTVKLPSARRHVPNEKLLARVDVSADGLLMVVFNYRHAYGLVCEFMITHAHRLEQEFTYCTVCNMFTIMVGEFMNAMSLFRSLVQ